MLRPRTILFVCVGLAAAAGLIFLLGGLGERGAGNGSGARGSGAPPRHVLLISIDTLRRDRLGAYGYARAVSPAIDALAARGVVFEQAIAQAPWTAPSHASMMTSLYPSVLRIGKYRDPGAISPAAETLAEAMKRNGFRTYAVTENAFLSPEFGFDQGFDVFHMRPDSRSAVASLSAWLGALKPQDRFFAFFHTYDVHEYEPPAEYSERFVRSYDGILKDPERLLRKALETHARFGKAVARFSEEEWRQVLALREAPGARVDAPLAEVAGFVREMNLTVKKILQNHQDYRRLVATFREEDWRYVQDLYDSTIAFVDDQLSALFSFLERRGLMDDTLILFTSDHGEEFGEHGYGGHGYTLFDENLRVPLILVYPSLAPRRVDPQVRILDLVPTILDLLAFEPSPVWQGTSLVPIMGGAPTRLIAISENAHSPLKSVRTPAHKYIASMAAPYQFLFDLAADPTETGNLAAGPPQSVQSEMRLFLLQSVLAHAADATYAAGAHARISPEVLEQKRALGYVSAGDSGGEPDAEASDWVKLLEADLSVGGARRASRPFGSEPEGKGRDGE
ncbi:MAG: sulfatase [Planctomycetes bacterium]|nr:sulfatase [Planctomycetota bacterium]